MTSRIDNFLSVYQIIDKHNLAKLQDIYHQEIVFTDPLHQIKGIDALTDYFKHLYENVVSIRFDFERQISIDDSAFIYWTMHYQHPVLNRGRTISVQGHTYVKFIGDKVIEHHDYFDMGQLLYRHIPLLGAIIRWINKRINN